MEANESGKGNGTDGPYLVKIVGRNGLFGYMQRFESSGPYGENIVDILHLAFNEQICVVEDGGALAIENVGHDDGIGDAGFIFHAEEQQSFGSPGTLAANDAAGDKHRPAIADRLQLIGWRDAESVQLFAVKGDRVFADCQVSIVKIGIQPLTGAHGLQRLVAGGWWLVGEKWTGGAEGQFGIP